MQTSIHIVDHRERIGFVRSMFCRNLKLNYDKLARSQLSGFPRLAMMLRHSVDEAKDMVERQADEATRLADLSIVLRTTSVHWLLLHMARVPDGCAAKMAGKWGKRLRQWARHEAVFQLTTVMCYLSAHHGAQETTRHILSPVGKKDEWRGEVSPQIPSCCPAHVARTHYARVNISASPWTWHITGPRASADRPAPCLVRSTQCATRASCQSKLRKRTSTS